MDLQEQHNITTVHLHFIYEMGINQTLIHDSQKVSQEANEWAYPNVLPFLNVFFDPYVL